MRGADAFSTGQKHELHCFVANISTVELDSEIFPNSRVPKASFCSFATAIVDFKVLLAVCQEQYHFFDMSEGFQRGVAHIRLTQATWNVVLLTIRLQYTMRTNVFEEIVPFEKRVFCFPNSEETQPNVFTRVLLTIYMSTVYNKYACK